MSVVETRYEQGVLDDNGVPLIAGTTTKVVELVVEKMAYGWSPEEFHLQHPYLSLGQIYSAHFDRRCRSRFRDHRKSC
ncbi:MAG: DUF433 domain-containing protein [Roseiflexaceae bacterium]